MLGVNFIMKVQSTQQKPAFGVNRIHLVKLSRHLQKEGLGNVAVTEVVNRKVTKYNTSSKICVLQAGVYDKNGAAFFQKDRPLLTEVPVNSGNMEEAKKRAVDALAKMISDSHSIVCGGLSLSKNKLGKIFSAKTPENKNISGIVLNQQ